MGGAKPTCGSRVRSGRREGDVLIDNEDGTYCVEWEDGEEEDAVPAARLEVLDAAGDPAPQQQPAWTADCPADWEPRSVCIARKVRRQEAVGVVCGPDGTVTAVRAGGAASRQGLTVGMRIVGLNGAPLPPGADHSAALEQAGAEFTVNVFVPPPDPSFAAAREKVEAAAAERAREARIRHVPDIFACAESDPRNQGDPRAQMHAAAVLAVHFLMITADQEVEERQRTEKAEAAARAALMEKAPGA